MHSPDFRELSNSYGHLDLRSLSFGPVDSRRAIEELSNQLLGALIQDCRSLLVTDNLDSKVALGARIGYVGRAIEELRRRSFELAADHPSGWELDAGVTSGEISGPFAGIYEPQGNLPPVSAGTAESGDLGPIAQQITSITASLDSVKDEPTIMVLQTVQELLKKALLQDRNVNLCAESTESSGSMPGRPASLRRGARADIANVSFEETARDDAHLARLMHFIYVDVEIPVMEICSRNILDFPHMPVQFKLDMARQIWDEARHAAFMREGFERKGVKLGDYSYSANSWKMIVENESLVERLVIEQIILEGNGLDAGVLIAAICRERGDIPTALCFEFQNVDELTHCRIGHRWLRHLLGDNESQYKALIERCSEKINQKVPGSAPVAIKARIAAGFPERFVMSLLQTQEPS
jgi:uncharacterized ferritin-like protein (DUF455 family)